MSDEENEISQLKQQLAQRDKDIQMKDIALKGTSGLRAKLNAAGEEIQKLKEEMPVGGIDPEVFRRTLERAEMMQEEIEQQEKQNELLKGYLNELSQSHRRQEIRSESLLDRLDDLPASTRSTIFPTLAPRPQTDSALVPALLQELKDMASAHEDETMLATGARHDEHQALELKISSLTEDRRLAATEITVLENTLERETLKTAEALNEVVQLQQSLERHEATSAKTNGKLMTACHAKLEGLRNQIVNLEEQNLKLQHENVKSETLLLEKDALIGSLQKPQEQTIPEISIIAATSEEPAPSGGQEGEDARMAELQSKYDETRIALEEARVLLKERESDLQTKTEELDTLRSEYYSLDERHRQLAEEAPEAKEAIDKEVEEVISLERQASNMSENHKIEQLGKQVKELEMQLRAKEAELQQADSDRKEANVLEHQAADLTERLHASEEDAALRQKESLSMREEISAFERQTSELRELMSDKERDVAELQQQNKTLKKNMEALETNQSNVGGLEEQVRFQEQEIIQLQSKNEEFKGICDHLETQNGVLSDQLRAQEEKGEELKSCINEQSAIVEKAASMDIELENCKAELKQHQDMLTKKNNDIEALKEELTQFHRELSEESERHNSREAVFSECTSELEALKTQLEAQRVEQETTKKSLESKCLEVSAKKDLLASVQESCREQKEQIADLQKQIAILENRVVCIPNLEREMEEKDMSVRGITEKLSAQKKKAAAAEEELLIARKEFEKKEAGVQQLLNGKDEVIKVLKEDIIAKDEASREEAAAIESRYLAKQAEVEAIQAASGEESKKLRRELLGYGETIRCLKDEIAAVKQDEVNKESKELEELETVLASSQKDGEVLRTQLAEARAAVVAGMAETTRRMALEKKITHAEGEIKRQREMGSAELRTQLQEARAAVAVGIADTAKLHTQLKHAKMPQQENVALAARLEEMQGMLHESQKECHALRQELHSRREPLNEHELVALQTNCRMMEEELSRKDRQLLEQAKDMEELKRASMETNVEQALRKELATCRKDMMKLGHTHRELVSEFELVRTAKKHAEKKLADMSNPSLYSLVRTMKKSSAGDPKKVETLAGHLSQITDNHHMTEAEVDDAVLMMLEKRLQSNNELLSRLDEHPPSMARPVAPPPRPSMTKRYQSPTAPRTPRSSTVMKQSHTPPVSYENPGRTPSINRRVSPGRYMQSTHAPRTIWR
eukprot:TRINITY_DN13295_c0_g1_i1.p1 TRINITY_DN13295_c0_g1~~TRINITY_DN13295_c0_g1_i1.p1  ORF type:complete len:1210 (+),score=347.31 TRINITY_DN13295_c0_g1_i1:67-3696(+)